MKKILLAAIVSIALINCNNDDNGEQSFTPQVITPILIAQEPSGGPFYNFPNEASIYFTDENEWESFKTDYWIQSTNYPEAIINFNEHMPIVCMDESRPDSGYVLNINSIIEYQDSIVVEVESIYGGGAQTPSRPFIAVKIPTTEKLIVFE